MAATYFMGARQGTAKNSGNSYYAISLLYENRFGSWELKDKYTSPQLFAEVSRQGFLPGVPVVVTFGMDSNITNIQIDSDFSALDLN